MRGIIVVLAIVFIGVLGTVFFVGRHNRNKVVNLPPTVNVSDYATDDNASVRWTIQGRMVGDDTYRSARITITPTNRKAEVLEGYQQKVSQSVDLPNNKEAFNTFMLALKNLHFDQLRTGKQSDERGVCPLGYRYIYEINEGDATKQRLWSDSCSSSDGTMAGRSAEIRAVFKAQITDYDRFISGVKF